MFHFADAVRKTIKTARIGQLLLWCLPALILGLVLRVALTSALPYAYFHDDAPDYLCTADRLINDHQIEVHQKKSFLTPALFAVPFLVRVPAMVAIPIFQHLLGLVMVVLTGALCRLWLEKWRFFIIPVTLLFAANPSLIWYEHTLMAESHFAFTSVLLALAGTLYARSQSTQRFVFLCIGLFLHAGARPEGKLFFGFAALLLVMLHFRDWRARLPRFATLLVLGVATFHAARTKQGGLLLYTSVARFTPADLRCAPGFDPYIRDIRDKLQSSWEKSRSFPSVQDRREIAASVERYLAGQTAKNRRSKPESTEKFCLKLARETCMRNLTSMPGHVLNKFRTYACDTPAGLFDFEILFDKQRVACVDPGSRVMKLAGGLFGRTFNDTEELSRFIDASYAEVAWLNTLSNQWYSALARFRLPDETFVQPSNPQMKYTFRGLPLYMLAACAGLITAGCAKSPNQRFHIAWGISVLAFAFIVILTANVRARFRFFLEPFWFIYIAMLFDCVIRICARPCRNP